MFKPRIFAVNSTIRQGLLISNPYKIIFGMILPQMLRRPSYLASFKFSIISVILWVDVQKKQLKNDQLVTGNDPKFATKHRNVILKKKLIIPKRDKSVSMWNN